MFDPHRIGPRRSSSYARNKGRVIQRKLVNTPSPGYTRSELEQLVPLMQKNGFIPPPPSVDFGRVISYRVMAGGVDITADYNDVIDVNIAAGVVPVNRGGDHMLVVPNVIIGGVNCLVFKPFTAIGSGYFSFDGLTSGTRLYPWLGEYDIDALILTGDNGTVVSVFVGRGPDRSVESDSESVLWGAFAFPM